MRIEATAPAKLILSGEYAVLEGAPAVVMAVNRRVRVVVEPAERWSLISDLLPGPIQLDVDALGGLRLPNGRPATEEPGCAALALAAALRRTPPLEVRIESAALRVSPDGAKLGLGSSAAVVVALLQALEAAAGTEDDDEPADLETALRLHHALQHGKGSGVDVAASHTGGLCRFVRPGHVRPLALPPGLAWAVVWTGEAAKTTRFLERLDLAREAAPEAVDQAMTELRHRAELAADAFEKGNIPPLLEALDGYRLGLERLGRTIEAPILSPPHRRLVEVAWASGAVYKPSGAGGGDVGVLFAGSARDLEAALRGAEGSGFAAISVDLDPEGVCVHVADQDQGS